MTKESDILSIAVGETWRHAGMVARADGEPITAGTVNYYLKCLTGTDAGKWWKDSDQTWAAVETANPMTHQADGGWTIELAESPFSEDIMYYEYAKESGNLHVPAEGRLLRGQPVIEAGSVSGPGDDLVTMNISHDGVAVVGARVWITTDSAGANTIAGYVTTDSSGNARFLLTNGSYYYLWCSKSGWQGIQGQYFRAVKD